MLNGREKMGKTGIDWVRHALGKTERKTIGFGQYDKRNKAYEDELYIRELPLIDGALGCAIWDGAVCLTRWMYEHTEIFKDRDILELGSGCGLPGIFAARFARSVTLTDYISKVLDNLRYNIGLNSVAKDDVDGADTRSAEAIAQQAAWRENVGRCTRVLYLDWDNCADVEIERADIILGAELTYSMLSVDTLIDVVDRFLKPEGIFYEVLSDDRDGVQAFVKRIRERGFLVDAVSVTGHLTGNFNTRSWTFQDVETYKIFSFRRPGCVFPVAGGAEAREGWGLGAAAATAHESAASHEASST